MISPTTSIAGKHISVFEYFNPNSTDSLSETGRVTMLYPDNLNKAGINGEYMSENKGTRIVLLLSDSSNVLVEIRGLYFCLFSFEIFNDSSRTFKDAFLIKANFEGAFLIKANFTNAYLMEANLKDSSLTEADFEDANLYKADLRGADGLNLEQLSKAKSLYLAKFDQELHNLLEKEVPDLIGS